MAIQAPTKRRPGRALAGTGGPTAALFLVPFFVVFALAMVAPVIYSLVLSFHAQQKSGLGFSEPKTVFVGLENYVQVFQSQTFMEGIGRLALYCLIYIPCMVGGAVAFSLLLDATVARARKLFQLLVFLPHAVPGVIAALIWAYLYTPGISPLVQVLQSGGIQLNFLDAHLVLPSIVNIGVWEWTGYNVIILFTALQAVPREILEAARVDGAGEIRAAVSIKFPLILPALSVIMLFTIIGTLQLFTEPSIISKATASVTSTWVPNLWAYDAAFIRHNLNQAAAASIIIAGLAAILSLAVTRFSSRMNKS
ncbi:carbohydrate ABC transporter permease [Paenarthrobacter ilicis]|uniref:Multiple sugar transport system permease protein n=1 Tax=Paenarthrobacter ilicis TaxID=43665 RepID=A0ABX0TKZ2_9MICC|nr:sugar ABC transporter permease [Paenarthrobacter ilicis]MBM7794894.1 multiple sugar transport system permease protein [Paenarthrobacter ilicis]NIJ02525.1 multiple sugar transport system permease protein [Paenarthrobacter ilicis]